MSDFRTEENPSVEDCHNFAKRLENIDSMLDGQLVDEHWYKLEPLFTVARRKLIKSHNWRYGPLFVHDTARSIFKKLSDHGISIVNKVYCELGCGIHHPYGISAVMFINGAKATVAADLQPISDDIRAAEALSDLLLDCLADSDKWHWSELSKQDFLTRINSFNLQALKNGDLKNGLASLPMRHVITDIYHPSIETDSIDIMSSRAVLEHFLDFGKACSNLYKIMKPEGIGYHVIDLVDHRAYGSQEFNWWTFLGEDEQWSDGACNRLRFSEIREYLERTGFKIMSCEAANKAAFPTHFRGQLNGRFSLMSDEELSIIRMRCVIKKTG